MTQNFLRTANRLHGLSVLHYLSGDAFLATHTDFQLYTECDTVWNRICMPLGHFLLCDGTQSLENQIWRSRLAISTKLKLYNTCILPIFLYGSDCWAISKTDGRNIDALDQWCLRMLHGIKWYQSVWNDDVRRLTKQPKLTAIIQSCWLTLFGHIMRMDDNADTIR